MPLALRLKGHRFSLVITYRDIEGRGYRCGWGLRTERDSNDNPVIDIENEIPCERFTDIDFYKQYS